MEIPLDKVKCIPPGSMGTALDVDVDTGKRSCGMCMREITCKLHELCPHCQHRLDWFQLLSMAEGGLSASPGSEKALERWLKRYKARRQPSCYDEDGPDED